jgi:hypothetical protein
VSVADKVYGVTHANRVSQVDPITKAHALEFLQTEEQGQQAAHEAEQQQQQAAAARSQGRRRAGATAAG